jgi:hypothetical protein
VNGPSDPQSLKDSVQNLMVEMNATEAFGVEQLLEAKFWEITKLRPEWRRPGPSNDRKPSCDDDRVGQI